MEETTNVTFTCQIEIESDKVYMLNYLKHHIECLFDLDNWSEIKNVSTVEIEINS